MTNFRELLESFVAAPGDELITLHTVEIGTAPEDRLGAAILLHCFNTYTEHPIGEIEDALQAATFWLRFQTAAVAARQLVEERPEPKAAPGLALFRLRHSADRGVYADFRDDDDQACLVECDSGALWVGPNDNSMRLDRAQAGILATLLEHYAQHGDLDGLLRQQEGGD